jgi:hypothetical protein
MRIADWSDSTGCAQAWQDVSGTRPVPCQQPGALCGYRDNPRFQHGASCRIRTRACGTAVISGSWRMRVATGRGPSRGPCAPSHPQ